MREARILACIVSAYFFLSNQPIGYNPDGLEMIALARSWLGEGPPLEAGGYWPPLWPFLIAIASRFEQPEIAGWIINLLLAGMVVVPLYRWSFSVGGVVTARLSVFLYALLPSVREHAAVLDARPLGTFLETWCLCLATEGAIGPALVFAALAGLSRPEGILLVPILMLISSFQKKWKMVGLSLISALPTLLRPGASVRGWEAYTGPWLGLWPNNDLLALFGPNSAPTPYRSFVLRVEAAGIESPPSFLQNLLLGLPNGIELLKHGFPSALGAAGLILSFWGAFRISQRGRKQTLLVGTGFLVIGPILLLPMARDQATPATNLMFLVPPSCLLMGVALQSERWLSWALATMIAAEANWGPFRGSPPTFFEGLDAAATMRDWLSAHPPPSGHVACRLSGRGVVISAGLIPDPLPSSWEEWKPLDGTGVLLTTVDLRGADGGRGLEIMEDPRWEVRSVFSQEQYERWPGFLSAVKEGKVPERLLPSRHWLLYLESRPEP